MNERLHTFRHRAVVSNSFFYCRQVSIRMLLVSQQQWVTVCVSLVESCQEDKPSDVNMKRFTFTFMSSLVTPSKRVFPLYSTKDRQPPARGSSLARYCIMAATLTCSAQQLQVSPDPPPLRVLRRSALVTARASLACLAGW